MRGSPLYTMYQCMDRMQKRSHALGEKTENGRPKLKALLILSMVLFPYPSRKS